MAVWSKKLATITLRRDDNGKYDTASHTVVFRPVSVGSSGDISGTQLTTLYAWQPASNLDTTEAYDIYVDSVRIKRIYGPDMLPDVGV